MASFVQFLLSDTSKSHSKCDHCAAVRNVPRQGSDFVGRLQNKKKSATQENDTHSNGEHHPHRIYCTLTDQAVDDDDDNDDQHRHHHRHYGLEIKKRNSMNFQHKQESS